MTARFSMSVRRPPVSSSRSIRVLSCLISSAVIGGDPRRKRDCRRSHKSLGQRFAHRRTILPAKIALTIRLRLPGTPRRYLEFVEKRPQPPPHGLGSEKRSLISRYLRSRVTCKRLDVVFFNNFWRPQGIPYGSGNWICVNLR